MPIQLFEAQFDKKARLLQPQQEGDIREFLSNSPVTDVLVLCHGWNEDMDDARTLYRAILRNFEAMLPQGGTRTFAAIGILWPSKKFADADLIPGGAASAVSNPAENAVLERQIDAMKSVLGSNEADEKLERMSALVPKLESSADAQREFVRLLGEAVQGEFDDLAAAPEEGSPDLTKRDGAEILAEMRKPVLLQVQTGAGGAAGLGTGVGMAGSLAAGGSAGLFSSFGSSIKAGAMRLMNLTTYYVMKDRAGVIGREGVNPMLHRLQSATPQDLRWHMAGHSFGGRLVTAAVDGPHPLRVKSLVLLQAAFSHNGFAEKYDGRNDGFFHRVLLQKKVDGPILVTHTKNDKAVGLAYPLASRMRGDTAAALGDANDVYGGIGRNGAQHVTSAIFETLRPAGGTYSFRGGSQVYNLLSDQFISGHSDVANPEVAQAMAAAMLL